MTRAEIVEVLTAVLNLELSITSDLSSAHAARSDSASEWMREDDRDQARDWQDVCRKARSLLARLEAEPPAPTDAEIVDAAMIEQTIMRFSQHARVDGCKCKHCVAIVRAALLAVMPQIRERFGR